MTTIAPALEIHIHLEDGRIAKFAQPDAALAKKILDSIQPSRLFQQPHFIIDGDYAMTAFPTPGICRIDFIGADLPVWPFHYNASYIQQIMEDEFRQRFQPANYDALRQSPPPAIGTPILVYAEIEQVNGARIFVELQTRLEPRSPLDQSVFIQQLLSSGGLHAARHGGGVLIINPAKIVRLAAYPGPPTPPAGAWQAHRLST